MNGYWNVYNRDGEEFRIHVKNGMIPQPSEYEGEVWCEFKEMFCLNRSEMCFPDCISVEKKSKNNLVMKEYANAREIWMRDLYMEEQILMKKSKFVELMKK
jgi:hypothetical protein